MGRTDKHVLLLILCALLPTGPIQGQIITSIEITSTLNEQLKQKSTNSLEYALSAFQRAYTQNGTPELPPEYFTERGRTAIQELWSRAPFRCLYTSLNGPLVRRQIDGNYEFRGVTLHVKDQSDSTFTEEGLFILSPDGKVADFRFGLDVHRYARLIEDRKSITEFKHRQIILDFIDNFKTAYNRKDLSFLQDVFSENALIIVGRVVQPKQEDELSQNLVESLGTELVEFIRLSKIEYLSRLEQVFSNNEYIKVEFDSVRIHQHSRINGIYGVQLFQYWHSYSTRQAGYRDEGYLFLMIDIRDVEAPIIHVRTWQPEAFTNPDEVINLSNFRIIQ